MRKSNIISEYYVRKRGWLEMVYCPSVMVQFGS